MWDIGLIDIGGDGLVTHTQVTLDTLQECEILASGECARHLGVQHVVLEHDEDLIYDVKVNGLKVGAVMIRSL